MKTTMQSLLLEATEVVPFDVMLTHHTTNIYNPDLLSS